MAKRLDELSSLAAHLSAARARWLELVWRLGELVDASDYPAFVAYRFGITRPEARECMRVAEALHELPAILHARLAAEDGTVLVMALDAARARILERRRAERARAEGAGGADVDPVAVEPPDPRPLNVESLLELAGSAVDGSREHGAGEQVLAGNTSAGIAIDHDTLRHGIGLQQDLRRTVAAISGVVVGPEGALTA